MQKGKRRKVDGCDCEAAKTNLDPVCRGKRLSRWMMVQK